MTTTMMTDLTPREKLVQAATLREVAKAIKSGWGHGGGTTDSLDTRAAALEAEAKAATSAQPEAVCECGCPWSQHAKSTHECCNCDCTAYRPKAACTCGRGYDPECPDTAHHAPAPQPEAKADVCDTCGWTGAHAGWCPQLTISRPATADQPSRTGWSKHIAARWSILSRGASEKAMTSVPSREVAAALAEIDRLTEQVKRITSNATGLASDLDDAAKAIKRAQEMMK